MEVRIVMAWAQTLWQDGSPLIQWAIVSCAALLAACTDLSSRRIPNWLTLPLLVSGAGYAVAVGGGAGLLDSLAACFALGLPYVFLFVFARGGAGDAKLMSAIGAWIGMINGLAVLAAVALCGVVLAIGYALLRRRGAEVAANLVGMAQGLAVAASTRSSLSQEFRSRADSQNMMTMPYGVTIFVGVCIAGMGVTLWRM